MSSSSPGNHAFTPAAASALLGGSRGLQSDLRHAGPFVVSITKHSAGFTAPSHVHERASLNVVLEGAYAELSRGRLRVIGPGIALAKPAWESHANHFESRGARCLLLEIDEMELDLMRACSDVFDIPVERPTPFSSIELAAIVAAVREGEALALEAELYRLVNALSRSARLDEETRPDRWLRQIREQIREAPDHPWRLDELARAAGRHPAHVARAF